jgi:transcriptional regulator with XRE-family HTH domain
VSTTGEIIKQWRQSVPLTREQLAVAVGRCMTTVARWERNKVEPRIADVRSMREVDESIVERLFADG